MELLRILALPLTFVLIGLSFLGCVGHLLELNYIEFLKLFLILAVPAVLLTYYWIKKSRHHTIDLIIAFSLLGLVFGFSEDVSIILVVTSGAPLSLMVCLAIFSKYAPQKSVSQ